MSTSKYSLSANNSGLTSATWKTNSEFRNTLSGYNSTEMVSGILRNLRKITFAVGPVNSLWSNTSSSVTAQNILISRLSVWELYLLSHLGISPLATNNHTSISDQQMKSRKTILKSILCAISGVDVWYVHDRRSQRRKEGRMKKRTWSDCNKLTPYVA